MIPYRESEKEEHKYIEGLDKLGDDMLLKHREKTKEVGCSYQIDKKAEFIPYGRPDVWSTTLHVSQSMRTKAMDDLMKNDPVYDHFSTNGFLDSYKQTLVQTGNVDHIIPFKHSQNKRGLKINFLRQKETQKLYPMSACNELAKEYFLKSSIQDEEPGMNLPMHKKDSSIIMNSKNIEGTAKLPRLGAMLSRQTIAEEGPETIPSERDKESINRGSRGSVTSSIRRFGHRKGKEVSEKEKVDKLVKIYFK